MYNYKKGDFNGLRSAIEAIDLSNAIHQDDVNTSWLEWKDTFLAAVEDYIPTKRIKGRNSPPWINGGPRPEEERSCAEKAQEISY